MSFRLDSALRPPLAPDRSAVLTVGGGQEVYWEEAGNPAGVPLVILHGGPGGGINPYYRQLFDPTVWRAILFEQRGCGRSTPHGQLEGNDTQALVRDMEALREALGVDRWVVMGGSWGSTLALVYAETHPRRCLGVLVTGVFLARREDSDWWWHGVRKIFPDVWQGLHDFLPPAERGDLRGAYLARILNDDPAVHEPALRAMLTFETQLLDVWTNWPRLDGLMHSDNLGPMGRLYAHYDANAYFLRENQIIEDAGRLKDVRGWIVQGRFDCCTPPSGAYDLSRAWPARLRIMPCAAHAWNDPILSMGVAEALADLAAHAR
ncbi:MAG TPA: prolyl aminopeptidase [Caulobacteraceae bacterium]|nr:prolyl aminopeptidase [Caulobacteraceae bacterium]